MSVRHKFAAAAELLRRYQAAFAFHWKQRHTLRTGLFNQQEAEFLAPALSLQECPDSPTLRNTARVLMALVLIAVMWSVLGHIDIVVNGSGKVIPSARTKTIASVDLASVRALHVSEGQSVVANQLLIELDSSASDAERDKASDSVAQARLVLARSQAMIDAVERDAVPWLPVVSDAAAAQWEAAREQLQSQYADFLAKRTRIDGEIERLTVALPLYEQRAKDFLALLAHQDVARHAWLEKEQARLEVEGQLSSAQNQRAALIAQTLHEAHVAMLDANKVVVASEKDAWRAGERSRLLKLTSPVDGTVQQLTVHTIGGVVSAAQPLMQVVPRESRVEVEAFLENKDVGFVHPGQLVAVKIDAFDYTKYGTISAVVSHVSQDAMQDERLGLIYATRIALDRDNIVVDGKSMPITAGMSVKVDIKTGTRRVIEYVLSPILKHQREAMRER